MKKKQDANTAANSTSPPNKAKKKKEATKSREWERDRRERLNNSFTDLSKLLPIEGSNAPPTKKIEILQKAFAYIKTLQQENAELLESGGLEKAWSREVKQLQCQVKELTSRIQQLARLVQDAGGKLPTWVSLPANQPIPPPLGKRQFLYSNRITQDELAEKTAQEKLLEPKQKKPRKAANAAKKKETNKEVNNTSSKKKKPRAAKKSESVASNANKDSIKAPTVAQLLNVPSTTNSVASTSGIVLLPPEKKAIDMPPGILVLKGNSSQPTVSSTNNLSSAGLLIVRTPASQSSSLAPGTCILLPSTSSQTPPTQQSPAQTTSLLTTPIMATGQPTSTSSATPTFVLTNGSLVPVLPSQNSNSPKQALPLAAKPSQENKNSNKIAIPKLPKRNIKSTKSPPKKKKATVEAAVNLEPIKSIVVSTASESADVAKDVPQDKPESPEKQPEESKEEASKSEPQQEPQAASVAKPSESSGKPSHKSSYSIDALCQGKQTAAESEQASAEPPSAAESSKTEEKVDNELKPAETHKNTPVEAKDVTYPSEKPPEAPLAFTETMSVYSSHEFVPAEISPSGFIGPQPPMATVVDAPSKETLDAYSYRGDERAEHRSSPEVMSSAIPSSFSSDLFASLNVPSGHPESISPTAAFLLAFPLVSSSRTNEAEPTEVQRVDNTGSSLLQLGSMEEQTSVVELNSLMQRHPMQQELMETSTASKLTQSPREAKQYNTHCFPLNEPVTDYDAEISSIMSHSPSKQSRQPNFFSRPKPHKDNCVRDPYLQSEKQFVPLPVQSSSTLCPSVTATQHPMQQPMYPCNKKQLPAQQTPYQQSSSAHFSMSSQQNNPRCNIVNYNQPIFSTSVASSNVQPQKPSNPLRTDVCSQKLPTEQRDTYNQPIFSTSVASPNIQSQKPSNPPRTEVCSQKLLPEQRDGYNQQIFSTSVSSVIDQPQKPSNSSRTDSCSQKPSTEQRHSYNQPMFNTSVASSNIQSQKPSNSQKHSTEQKDSYNQPIFNSSIASSSIQSQKPSNSQKPITEQRDNYNQPIFNSSIASPNIQSQKPSNSQKPIIEQRDNYNQPIFSTSVASSNIQSQKPSNPPRTDVGSQKLPTERRDGYNQPIFSTSVANCNNQSQKPIPSNTPQTDICPQKHPIEQRDSFYNQPIFSTSVASANDQSQKPSNSQKLPTEQRDSYSQPIFSNPVASSNILPQKPSNSQKPMIEQRDSFNQPIFSTSAANSNVQPQKPSNPPRTDTCSQKLPTEQRDNYNQPIFNTSVANSNIQSQKPSNPPRTEVCSQKHVSEQRDTSHFIGKLNTNKPENNSSPRYKMPSPENGKPQSKPVGSDSRFENQQRLNLLPTTTSDQTYISKPAGSDSRFENQQRLNLLPTTSDQTYISKPAGSENRFENQLHLTPTTTSSQTYVSTTTSSQTYVSTTTSSQTYVSKPVGNESNRFDSQLNLAPSTKSDQTYVSKPDGRFENQQRLNLAPTTTSSQTYVSTTTPSQTYVSKPVGNDNRFDGQQRLNLAPTTSSSQAYACNIFNDYQTSNYLPLPPLSSASSSTTTDTSTFGSFSVAHNSSNFGILSWSTMSAPNSQQQQQLPSYGNSVEPSKQMYQHPGENRYPQQSRQISYPPPPSKEAVPTPRPPVNWMTDIPAQNSFEQAPCSNPSVNYTSNYPDYTDALNNTWQKSTQANPLPTLVGDLALGPPPATNKYCYKATAAARKQDKEKRGGADYCSSSFLSVSQLVDHTVKEPSRPAPSSRKPARPASKASSRRDRSKNTQTFNEPTASNAPTTYRPISNYPAPKPSYKATPSNYSAESLIAGIHPPPQQQDLIAPILHDKPERYPQSYPPRSHFSGESTNYFPESLDANYQQSSYPCTGNYQSNNYMNQTAFPDTELAASIPAPSFPPDLGSSNFLFPVTTAASVTSRPSFFPSTDAKTSRKRSRHLEQSDGYQDYQDFNAGRSTQQARCEPAPQNCAPTYRAAGGQVSTPPSNSVPGVASSSLTNFNLSTIFPDLNDKTPVPALPAFVSSKNLGAGAPLLPGAGTDYMLHHSNMGFNNLLSHNAPHQVGMRLNQSFPTPSFPNMMPPPSLPFSVHEH